MHALPEHNVYDQAPSWSPDGRRLAMAQYGGDAFTIGADGNGFRSLGRQAGLVTWLRTGDILFAGPANRPASDAADRSVRQFRATAPMLET